VLAACASPRRWRSANAISTPCALTAGAQWQGRSPPRDRHGRLGLGADGPLARRPPRAPGRTAVLRHRRPDPRAALVERQRARRVSPARRPSAHPAPLRTAPAAPRSRRRARSRRRGAQRDPAPARPRQSRHDLAGSGRGAVSALPPVRFPDPPSEPDVPIPEHPALHRTCGGRSWRWVRQRRFPAWWWLGLFRCPPTARECCAPDSDIGSLEPRRASEASCLRGWSSGAPSTVA